MRAPYKNQDIFTDFKMCGTASKWEGRIHAGFYNRVDKMPIKFAYKIVNDGYSIVLTGHTLGAARAFLVTVKLLTFLNSNREKLLIQIRHFKIKI